MDIHDTTVADAIGRLQLVEGQIRRVQQLLAGDRTCADVITQISAARRALDQVGFMLVADGLAWCVAHPGESGEGDRIEDVQRMFTKLA